MNCRIFSEAYKLLLVYPFFHWCFGKKEISIQKSKIDHIFDNAMLCVKFVERKWRYKIQCKYICAPGRPRWLPWYYNIINNTICYITALHIYMHISPCLYVLWQDCSPQSSHHHRPQFSKISKLCVEVGMWRGPIWYSETMENTEIFRCLNNKRQKYLKM